jgi:hypothetical protein
LGSINGSQDKIPLRQLAKAKYGSKNMSAEGALAASLIEPSCNEVDADKSERTASKFWDYACLNSVRVLLGKEPIEDFS